MDHAQGDTLEREETEAKLEDKQDPPKKRKLHRHDQNRSFYRRTLPCPPAVAFSSDDGRTIFREALLNGTMEGYFTLAEQFRTQDDPMFCGISTLTMSLNALAIDPGRKWKGAWRWYHEEMLDCCEPLEVVRQEGVTFDKILCLARCNGAVVDPYTADSSTEEEFRQHVKQSCKSREQILVVQYSRKAFSQTGDGHFSPIGGYHEEKDLVLILDVARYKYPPHWVPLSMMWESMTRFDKSTGKCRGYMMLEKAREATPLFFVVTAKQGWKNMSAFYNEIDVMLTKRATTCGSCGCSKEEGIRCFFSNISDALTRSISTYVNEFQIETIPEEYKVIIGELLDEIRKTPLYECISGVLESLGKEKKYPFGKDHSLLGKEIATILILASPPHIWRSLGDTERTNLQKWCDVDSFSDALKNEVLGIRKQIKFILEVSHCECNK